MFRYIEPEVAGGLGEETQMDSTVHPPLVKKLHLEFEGWLGDDILETFPCYVVTELLKNRIEERQLTGITFRDIFTTKSPDFIELYPDKKLPEFYWAVINGEYGRDDFFMGEDHRLVLSETAYILLTGFKIENATVEECR